MGATFWLQRFLLVYVGAFVAIGAAQLLQGRPLAHAVSEALIWAAASAGIFTAVRLYHSRRGRHCALCRDTPEMRDAGRE